MVKKIAIVALIIALSFVIGIFMMPPKIEIIRYVDVKAPPEKIWPHISTVEAWDSWDPWSGQAKKGQRPWKDGVLTIASVNVDKQEIQYTIDVENTKGDISLGIKPADEGTTIRWYHSYEGEYAPWYRLRNWLNRGSLALELDHGLEKLKEQVEK